MRPNEVSYKAIGAAMTVHSALGAGLLESAYEKALRHEFTRMKLQHCRQVRLPVEYDGTKRSPGYKIDFVWPTCGTASVVKSMRRRPISE
jgi:GxxExxY protein